VSAPPHSILKLSCLPPHPKRLRGRCPTRGRPGACITAAAASRPSSPPCRQPRAPPSAYPATGAGSGSSGGCVRRFWVTSPPPPPASGVAPHFFFWSAWCFGESSRALSHAALRSVSLSLFPTRTPPLPLTEVPSPFFVSGSAGVCPPAFTAGLVPLVQHGQRARTWSLVPSEQASGPAGGRARRSPSDAHTCRLQFFSASTRRIPFCRARLAVA